jgi:hypothetical protein
MSNIYSIQNQIKHHRITGNSGLKRMLEEVLVAYFKIMSVYCMRPREIVKYKWEHNIKMNFRKVSPENVN